MRLFIGLTSGGGRAVAFCLRHRFVFLSLLVLTILLLMIPPILSGQSPDPSFSARLVEQEVHGYGFPLGSTVTMTIDDPGNGPGADYTDNVTVVDAPWDPGNNTWAQFQLQGVFTLAAGQAVTLTDGLSTRATIVTNLVVTGADPDLDTVSGTADPGSEVWVDACNPGGCATRHETADASGNWTADYSVFGDEDFEQNTLDLAPASSGEARQHDPDGDSTQYGWRIPQPRFNTSYLNDWVNGWEWAADSSVTIAIDDPDNGPGEDYTAVAPTDAWGNFGHNTWPAFDVQSGQTITVTDGLNTKTHWVTYLAVTGMDVDADTVSGTASPGARVHVWVGDAHRHETAYGVGFWTADFSVPGDEGDEQTLFDLTPGVNGSAEEMDDDADGTQYDWHVPQPRFSVTVNNKYVNGWEWATGSYVNLAMDDPGNGPGVDYTAVQTADEWGNVNFDLQPAPDIVPGALFTVTDGTSSKSHEILTLSVTDIDLDADTVTGTAGIGRVVHVWVCGPSGCADRHPAADAGGVWTADFAHPGPMGDEQTIWDIVPGNGGGAADSDLDNDVTQFDWYVPNPRFNASHQYDWVNGWDWTVNSSVTIQIDDPASGPGVDYTGTATTDAWGNFGHNTQPSFDVVAGQTVTVTDGVSLKVHVITNLAITGQDENTDTVFGTADPGARIDVWACDSTHCVNRHETADGSGQWTANFAVPGDEGDEQDVIDLVPGIGGSAQELDADGDGTQYDWHVPNPTFRVSPDGNWVNGWDWQMNGTVTITFDDPANGQGVDYTGIAMTDAWGNFGLNTGPYYDVTAGQTVTVTDGYSTKVHLITGLSVTSADKDTDVVSGTAVPGKRVDIWACDPYQCANRHETADGSGNWAANYAIPGDEGDEQTTLDLVPGTGGGAAENDDDGDGTEIGWRIPNPNFRVVPNRDYAHGWEWPANATMTFLLDDPGNGPGVDYTTTTTADEWGNFNFNLSDAPDILPGFLVTVTDSLSAKSHAVFYLTVTAMDVDLDTVSGAADPGAAVHVWACDPGNCANRYVVTDPMGLWTADFAHPGPQGDEQLTMDIAPGTWGGAEQFDEDGDGTQFDWNVPDPHLGTRPNEDRVEGWGWTAGANVSLTIDDPGNGQGVDYTAVQTADDWGNLNFDLRPIAYDIVAGMEVTLTEGSEVQAHVVTNLMVTVVDIVSDTVSGTADPGTNVDVWTCDWMGCANRHETTDGSGNWTADFAHPGDLPDEQDIRDITVGMGGDSGQSDEDGDQTRWGWGLPLPSFNVWLNPGHTEVHGYQWTMGVTVTLTVDDPGTPESPDFTDAQAVHYDPCCGPFVQFIQPPEFQIQPGFLVTMSDGQITKTHTVRGGLSVTAIDVDADTVTGTAEPLTDLWVGVCWPGYCNNRNLMADADGNWTADFSVPGDGNPAYDIKPGDSGSANQNDEDGDSTAIGWNVPNPNFTVRLVDEQVHANEWPLGATLTMTIDDPGTPEYPDYTDTAVVVVADWDPNQTFAYFDYRDRYTMQAGHVVELTDGTTTKTHVVRELAVTGYDQDADTVSGTAAPGSDVDVNVCNWINCADRHEVADEFGNWTADFSVPGDEDWETATHDLIPGSGGEARQSDEDGDTTQYSWWVFNPNFGARLVENQVHGYQWLLGITVTLSIGDPTNGPGVDYTATGIPEPAEWDPNQTFVLFDFGETWTLQAGQVITLTDGDTAKTLVVTNLVITAVDFDADVIYGTADPNSEVYLNVNDGSLWVGRREWADDLGNWSSDYSVPGDEPWEWQTLDLETDQYIEANRNDPDGDFTNYYWQVPPFDCSGGLTVSGTVLEADARTPLADAHVQFDDFNTGEALFYTTTDGDGNFTCGLPDGQYRVWANWWSGGPGVNLGFSREYFSETILENATAVEVIGGVGRDDLIFTLDTPGFRYDYLSFNLLNPILSDTQVRQAIIYGTDRAAIIAATYPASPLLDSYLPSWHWAYTGEGLPDFNFNPQLARDTLTAAGWVDEDGDGVREKGGVRLHLVLAVPTGIWVREATYPIFVSNMADLGIEVELNLMDWSTFLTVIYDQHDFDLALLGWAIDVNDDTGADDPWNAFVTDAWANAGQYSNPAADALAAQATAAPTRAEKIPFASDHQEIVMNDLPILPLFQGCIWPDENCDGRIDVAYACPAGTDVMGAVYAADGLTPVADTTVHFDDFFTGEELFITSPDGSGHYSCDLPEGSYRLWADGGGYSREYYEETIFESATEVVVAAGSTITVDFTLDLPAPIYDHLTFNMADPIVSEAAVRLAIAYGTDRAAIIAATYPSSPIWDSYLPSFHWAYAGDGLPQYGYDPQLARDILELAGWVDEDSDGIRERDGVRLRITYYTTDSELRQDIYTVFVANMADVGIEIEVHALPPEELFADDGPLFGTHEFGLAQFAWITDANSDMDVGSMFDSGNSQWNAGQYNNPMADLLLDLAGLFGTRAAKQPFLADHQRLVMLDLATLPLLQRCDAPDSDCDGVTDTVDACPLDNHQGYDADGDGCLDTFDGLIAFMASLPDADLDPALEAKLVARVEGAESAYERGRTARAINLLRGAINQTDLQRGKRVSDWAADVITAYLENLITLVQIGGLPR
ncbi:MAG: ABC transporter substrate-binding protein [Chloroflexota bacterium]